MAAGGEGGVSALALPHLFAGFGGAFEFIFHKQSSNVTGGNKVGGFEQELELAWTQIYVSALALLAGDAGRDPDRALLRPQGQRRTDRGRASATPAAPSPSWS